MNDKVTILIEELTQICEQYKSEVPSRRRAWPQSIKKRIFELRRLGIGAGAIAEATQIPLQTIYSWSNRKPDGGTFLPVPVVVDKRRTKSTPSTPTVTVRQTSRRAAPPSDADQNFPTVTVVTPSGYRLEGLTYEMMRELIAGLEGSRSAR